MLHEVDVGEQSIASYRRSAGDQAVECLHDLVRPLIGLRVLHLSATPYGGGVAEILRSEIPLLRDLGLAVDWQIIGGDERFFTATKCIHNGLQGAGSPLTDEQQECYLTTSADNARRLDLDYDVVVVHDPQPLAIPTLVDGHDAHWIWRCHIDTSEPNPDTWAFVRPLLAPFDIAVFTLGGFVPPEFPVPVAVIPPAIDPESPKNIQLDSHLARHVLSWIGVDLDRPLVTQVSRFDPWKDPLGVVEAYRLARAEVPDLQLALVGSMALDDPEAWTIYRQIQDEVRNDDSIHTFTNLNGVGNIEVNAFQTLSTVTIQKSIREGFGLVVSESLWKRTPVVAGHAGGIPLQLQDGVGGYLVDSVQGCAERLVELCHDPELRRQLGDDGHAVVRSRFLLPRLLADELRLYASALDGDAPAPSPLAATNVDHDGRDPVCGIRLEPGHEIRQIEHDGVLLGFCSASCAAEFARDPARFLRGVHA